jgi:hypothetical protein
MHNAKKPIFEEVCAIPLRFDREAVMSKYYAGGYRLVVRQTKIDKERGEYKEYLKGAVVIPNVEKLVELAYKMLDIADREKYK